MLLQGKFEILGPPRLFLRGKILPITVFLPNFLGSLSNFAEGKLECLGEKLPPLSRLNPDAGAITQCITVRIDQSRLTYMAR